MNKDGKCFLIAQAGDYNAKHIADLNGFEIINYEIEEFRDGSHQICVDLSPESIQHSDFALLFYVFKKPFDGDIPNVLRLLMYLKERFGQVVLLVPFMPFLREKVDGTHTDSLLLFDCFKILTLDAHITRDNIVSFEPIGFKTYIERDDLIVLPDAGARRYLGGCENDYVCATKDRSLGVVFDDFSKIQGRNCIILDDIVDTGYTLRHTISKLKEHNAKSIKACITHYLMNDEVLECPTSRFYNWGLDFLYIYDTVLTEKKIDCAHVLSYYTAFSNIKEKCYALK